MSFHIPAGFADQDLYLRPDSSPKASVRNWGPEFSDAARTLLSRQDQMPAETVVTAAVAAYGARISGTSEFGFGLRFSGEDTRAGSAAFHPVSVSLDKDTGFPALLDSVAQQIRACPQDPGSPWPRHLPAEWSEQLPFGITVTGPGEPNLSEAPGATLELLISTAGIGQWRVSSRLQDAYLDLLETRLSCFFRDLAATPEMPVVQAATMSPAERTSIVIDYNRTDHSLGVELDFVKCLQGNVDKSPDHPAVIFDGQTTSYGDFNRRVNRLARWLHLQGVQQGDFVALFLERSPSLVEAIWACMKVGAAFVPLSTEDPEQRLREMIDDFRPKALLSQHKLLGKLDGACDITLALDDPELCTVLPSDSSNPNIETSETDLAYLMYTSGSTGKPKGVLIEHGGIRNRLHWMQHAFPAGPEDRFLLKAPYTFDIVLWEVVLPFLAGSTLVVAEPDGHLAPGYLARLIAETGVTYVHFVPSVMRLFMLVPGLEDSGLQNVFVGGEALEIDLATRILQRLNGELQNEYGPTETSIGSFFWRCNKIPENRIIPIGKPISNTGAYILDEHDRPVPMGVPGQLHIGGVCLARGYLNRPDLTAERFIESPLPDAPHRRLYRTGDLARLLPDGNIQYLGRNDFQVKLHGVRIELGEIETVLRSCEGVRTAVVLAEGEGASMRLNAYVETEEGHEDPGHLTAAMKQSLPSHMMPRHIFFVKAMPLTKSGKLDRLKLAEMSTA